MKKHGSEGRCPVGLPTVVLALLVSGSVSAQTPDGGLKGTPIPKPSAKYTHLCNALNKTKTWVAALPAGDPNGTGTQKHNAIIKRYALAALEGSTAAKAQGRIRTEDGLAQPGGGGLPGGAYAITDPESCGKKTVPDSPQTPKAKKIKYDSKKAVGKGKEVTRYDSKLFASGGFIGEFNVRFLAALLLHEGMRLVQNSCIFVGVTWNDVLETSDNTKVELEGAKEGFKNCAIAYNLQYVMLNEAIEELEVIKGQQTSGSLEEKIVCLLVEAAKLRRTHAAKQNRKYNKRYSKLCKIIKKK